MNDNLKDNKCFLKKDSNGFTLVELIVVLVILSILAAILVPALLGYIDEAKKKQYVLDARNLFMATQSKLNEVYSKRGNYKKSHVDSTNSYYQNHSYGPAWNIVENGRGSDGATAWLYDYSFSRDIFKLAGYDIIDQHPEYNWYQKNTTWNTKTDSNENYCSFLCIGVGNYEKYLNPNGTYDPHKAYTAYFMIYQPKEGEDYYLFDGKEFVDKWPFNSSFADSRGKFNKRFDYQLDLNGEKITIQFLILKTIDNKSKTAEEELKKIDTLYFK